MRFLVTGAGGMLGRDVVRAAEGLGFEVVALERSDLDVTDAAAVERTVRGAEPATVVNCAAYTAVDAAEDEEDAAMAVNATGAWNVASAAADVGAAVVYPSTDYVFDGTKGAPYAEDDVPNPMSAYGRTKAAGERATTAANPRHHVVRTSWLYGAHGPNFVETMLRLGTERDEIRVVDDQVGSPTYTGDLAAVIATIADADHGIHHAAAAGEVSWHGFAVEIFERAGIDCRVLPQTTEELGRPAPRPPYSVLRSERIVMTGWREQLAAYLAERAAVR